MSIFVMFGFSEAVELSKQFICARRIAVVDLNLLSFRSWDFSMKKFAYSAFEVLRINSIGKLAGIRADRDCSLVFNLT